MIRATELPSKVKAPGERGLNTVIEEGAMDLLSLDLLVLHRDDAFVLDTGENETAIVPLSGKASCSLNGASHVLKRKGVFEERGSALLVPRDTRVVIEAEEMTELALCKSRTGKKGEILYVPSEATKEKTVGRDNWQRKVVDIIDGSVDATRIVLGETYNQPGCWSSFPPHKHDTPIPGVEARMEEIYLFRLDPPEGFGTQTIYDGNEMNVSFKVEDRDAVTIPWGYHPVSAMPGYSLYYLWFLAGDGRSLMPHTDPNFKWLER